MIRREFRQALEAQHTVLVTLWVIFVCGILIYIAVAQIFLADRQLAISYAFAQTAKMFIWFLTFVDMATLVWWKRRFLTREAILGGAKRYKVLQALQGHKGESEERAATLVSSYVTVKVVAFALAEAVAIYGFALVLTSHYFVGQYILSIASGLLLLLEFPSRAFLTDLLDAVETDGSYSNEETA
ncbi:MAG TPA: hypothetical protein VGH50_07395 [Candidatus Binatia bacterium]|jgi:hypothetical protein